MQHRHHHIHLERRHYIKLTITVGCVASSLVMVVIPGYQVPATLLATATNVLWVWS